MQTHLKSQQRWLVLGILMLVLTACSTKVTRSPVEAPTATGGHWNDTDSRLTAEAMIKDALARPWAQRFTRVTSRGPVVIVGTVLNRTHEPLNTQTFVQDLERALKNSGQVQLVTDTVKPAGQEAGADFIFQGTINTLVDELEDTKAVVYQVDLELVDIASNVKVWLGQKKVKK
jgi:PBP1b-binding outer membrane lipoprotein LpoB